MAKRLQTCDICWDEPDTALDGSVSGPGDDPDFRRCRQGVLHLKWEGLSKVTGKTVRMAMPGGEVITGKATAVEADALVVNARKTSDENAYPKGQVRVPRTTLHRLDMQGKAKAGRIVGTVLGLGVGLAAGAGVVVGIEGSILGAKHGTADGVALVGLTAAGAVGGYFAGNALDKHWTVVEIEP